MNRHDRRMVDRALNKLNVKTSGVTVKTQSMNTLQTNAYKEAQRVKEAYQTGRDEALRQYTKTGQCMFFCSCAIALHNVCKFGETRIIRVLEEMQRIMLEELTSEDIVERCKRETGVECIDENGMSLF